ncbi:hypothetical protein VOLCADRAFT_93985 [Volvox carteri f. nagariensis]|uniref:Uncharacterized protein n=1 Tax=Volvox carteri f. nagariensis TaxID=3068 RepID=D8U3L6_VOLCA|nr:uncharacterized protein VOLCADRAFT_93985 [Volvox carteri f. nagariensis]EFJ45631.1 hypothetical protein VOLCADRAFT_93985 [Volvox carteri f. nagariensis]|eukprot:XP_002953321.1 hypothetical protein VOLCADRAFT_93985 [Volvox carteri f. nagariensis]
MASASGCHGKPINEGDERAAGRRPANDFHNVAAKKLMKTSRTLFIEIYGGRQAYYYNEVNSHDEPVKMSRTALRESENGFAGLRHFNTFTVTHRRAAICGCDDGQRFSIDTGTALNLPWPRPPAPAGDGGLQVVHVCMYVCISSQHYDEAEVRRALPSIASQ